MNAREKLVRDGIAKVLAEWRQDGPASEWALEMYSHAADDVLASPAIRIMRSAAWDEGFDVGVGDAGASLRAVEHGEDENPYRRGGDR